MFPGLSILWIILGVAAVLAVWVVLDVGFLIRTLKDVALLGQQGRVSDAVQAMERVVRTRRPMARLFGRVAMPGAPEAQLAMCLDAAGRIEEGLPWAVKAVALAEGRPALLAACLACESHLLVGLGRYDEARGRIQQLRALPGVPPHLEAIQAVLEMYVGRLDAALAVARELLEKDPREDSSRIVGSNVLSAQGDLSGAIEILLYQPSSGTKYYSPADLAAVGANPDTAKTFRASVRMHDAVMKPSRWLSAADAYLNHGDPGGAEYALERAREVLDGNVEIEMTYCRMRARLLATRAKPAEAAREIARGRELLLRVPKRSQKYETSQAEGECARSVGLLPDAVVLFEEALRLALHPIEKHATTFCLARTLEEAGKRPEAAARYREVVASGISTWMSAHAAEALARVGG